MLRPYRPHPYQLTAIQFLLENPYAGLFQEPGLGKTSETLAAFSYLRKRGAAERMLVICPLRPAYRVWPVEAQTWTDFSGLRVVVLHGKGKDERLRAPHDIAVINPEGLEWLLGCTVDEPVVDEVGNPVMNGFTGKPRMRRVRYSGAAEQAGVEWDMLVVDEATRFKHTNTLRSKLLRPHLHRFSRRVILTGSPAPNGLLDLFGQVFILDLGRALGRHITAYRNEFFYSTGYGGYTWLLQRGAEERIYERLRPLVLRMAAADYLDLPPIVYNTVHVDLPEAALRQYRSMETLLLAAVNGRIVSAANVGASLTKCRQIAAGGIYETPDTWHHLHDAKTEAVQELVEELSGQPALVAYEFQHDLERLRRALGDETPHIGGGVPASRMAAIERAWNAGEIPVLLAQPQSVAHGLNLQGTRAAVIWHTIPQDLELYAQLNRRVWRQGQRDRVVVHHIVARGTVDGVCLARLGQKDRTQQALLAALQDYARDRVLVGRAAAEQPRRARRR